MYYVICDGNALFFRTRQQAEEYQEENYYTCTGDVRPVPEGGVTHYGIRDNGGEIKAIFLNWERKSYLPEIKGWKKIEVQS